MNDKACLGCGKKFKPRRSISKYCSKACFSRHLPKSCLNNLTHDNPPKSRPWDGKSREDFKGSRHPNWKGGVETVDGYTFVYCPEHPYAHKGKVLEHRLVMERFLGRVLDSQELVHHLNGIRSDNRIENLMVISRAAHAQLHHKGKKRGKK